MDQPELERALFIERQPEPLLNAAIFGAWCVNRYQESKPIVPLSSLLDQLLRGLVPADPALIIEQLVQLAGIFHTNADILNGQIPIYKAGLASYHPMYF